MNDKELDAYLAEIDREIAHNEQSLKESNERLEQIEKSFKDVEETFMKWRSMVDVIDKNGYIPDEVKRSEVVEHLLEYSGLNGALKKGIVTSKPESRSSKKRSLRRVRV